MAETQSKYGLLAQANYQESLAGQGIIGIPYTPSTSVPYTNTSTILVQQFKEEPDKMKLSSEQKSTIYYAQAKGMPNEMIAFHLNIGNLSPGSIDRYAEYLKLVEEFDVTAVEEEEK